MGKDLNERSADVLDVIVERFIATGEPVGSTTVAGMLPERLSPATVRNVMADLESRGYLYQPHTSAGRVPTARGYGRHVRHLLRRGKLRPVDERVIRRRLWAAHLEVSGLLQRACSLLSEMSSHVGVLLAPPPADSVIRDVEFVALGGDRVLVMIVAAGGVVHTRTVELQEERSAEELERAAAWLLELVRDLTMREASLEVAADSAAGSPARSLALDLGKRVLDRSIDRAEVMVEGLSHLLGNPELTDRGVLQPLFAVVEDRTELGMLLTECGSLEPEVMIGAERLPEPLRSCALVAAGYGSAGRPAGALGILGPARMEYARTIPVVDAMARATSDMLTELSA